MSERHAVMSERHAVGEHRVSVTITRKTAGDLVVSQHSMERWFEDEDSAVCALQSVANVFMESEADATERQIDDHERGLRHDRERVEARVP